MQRQTNTAERYTKAETRVRERDVGLCCNVCVCMCVCPYVGDRGIKVTGLPNLVKLEGSILHKRYVNRPRRG